MLHLTELANTDARWTACIEAATESESVIAVQFRLIRICICICIYIYIYIHRRDG